MVLGIRWGPPAQVLVEELLPGGLVQCGGAGDDAVEIKQDRVVVARVDSDRCATDGMVATGLPAERPVAAHGLDPRPPPPRINAVAGPSVCTGGDLCP